MARAYFSLGLLLVIFLACFAGPLIYPHSPYALNADRILAAPSLTHIFGTDRLGRDILARVLEGGRTSLIIGVGSALASSFIGLIIGVSAGYFRGKVEKSVVVIIDLFLTFPTFFLLLALVSYVEASSLVLIIVISLTGWMGMARLIRSESYSISHKPFIKILKIAGVGPVKILFKYYLPLLSSIFLVSFTFGVGGAILAESGLSFLGLGVQSPQMSWGSVLEESRGVMDIAWWASFFPGLMIFIVTFSLINLSDFLQGRFNQKDIISG